MKSDPDTYSFDDLAREGETHWDGIRNFQARNYLKEMTKGDSVLIYHSGEERSIMGTARVTREAYPDPDPEDDSDWVQVDLAFEKKFSHPVELSQIKKNQALQDLLLLKQSRLSVMPVSEKAFRHLCQMGGAQ